MDTVSPAARPLAQSSRAIVLGGLGVLAVVMLVGAFQLAFLCDDAFITFRYVSNAHDGNGLVWNPPPFLPVEGYTGFLWALCLWATWSWFGFEPPVAANVLSMGFGLCLFAACALAALRLRRRDGGNAGLAVAFATLAVIVGNRTFLQWLTSGLETALFNLGFVAWVLLAFRARAVRSTGWLALWSTFAAIAALTRPDGLLLVAATGTVALVSVLLRHRPLGPTALGLCPLLTVVAHVLWRRSFYGEWLPNTYFAKVTAPWPEAGVRYVFCFVLEHGTWVALPLAVVWLVSEVRRGLPAVWRMLVANLPAAAVVGAVLFQVGYYVLRVGGDHFEYRVLSPLVPLVTLAVVAMALRLRNGTALPVVCVLTLGLASTFGWVHHAFAVAYPAPRYEALAPHVPGWLRPLVRTYDRHQAWLQAQFVCNRCNQHALALDGIKKALPPRARTATDPLDLPVVLGVTAGYIGWSMPDFACIDLLGLNDWVTARTQVRGTQAPFLQQPVDAALAGGDLDGDGIFSRSELLRAFGTQGLPDDPKADWNIDLMLVMFARAREDSLTRAELEQFGRYTAVARFMAHERLAPEAYVAAFDANVTIEDDPAGGRRAVVRQRAMPLGPERVRAIEQEWRARIASGAAR